MPYTFPVHGMLTSVKVLTHNGGSLYSGPVDVNTAKTNHYEDQVLKY